jgi:peroxisomal 2,4-dienoyl-CoA reductase
MGIFRDDVFAGRVALITGGGTGIGRGIAEALAAAGARTALLSRKAEHLEPTAAAIVASSGRPCLPLVADVRRPEQVEAAVARILDDFGRLDILVNAAAGNFLCPAADLSPNGFGTVLDIDAKGTFHACKAAFAAWMRDHGGQVLNISATLHYGGTPGQLHVAAAKAAVDALTRTLALEWGPLGIRVNAIAPGPISRPKGAPAVPGRRRRTAPGGDPVPTPGHHRGHRPPGPVRAQRRGGQHQRRDPRQRRRALPVRRLRAGVRAARIALRQEQARDDWPG